MRDATITRLIVGKRHCRVLNVGKINYAATAFYIIAVLKKVRYALCPMPYALCPMPYARRVPHVTEKGYISKTIQQ